MTATADVAVQTRERSRGRARLDVVPYLFVLPHFVFFFVFAMWPFALGLIISLFEYDVLRPEANKMGSSAAMSFVVALSMVMVSYLNFRLFRTREGE